MWVEVFEIAVWFKKARRVSTPDRTILTLARSVLRDRVPPRSGGMRRHRSSPIGAGLISASRAALMARRRMGSAGSSPSATAAVGIALGAHQHGAVFEPQDFRLLGRIAVDRLQRRAIGHRAGVCRLRAPTGSSSFNRRARISGRRVRPWITSDPSTTANAVQHDQVAIRKILRQRECGRQRDDATHAAPGHDDAALHRRGTASAFRGRSRPHARPASGRSCHSTSPRRCGTRITVASTAGGEATQYSHAHDPRRAAFQIGRNCMPISMKASTLSTKTIGFPHRVGRHAQPRGRARRRRAGDGDGVDDDGEDAGEPEVLGGDPDHEGGGELDDDGARRLGDAARDQRREAGEQEAGRDAADQRQQRWSGRTRATSRCSTATAPTATR